LSEGKYAVNIPYITENADILAAMRGPQQFYFDLIDQPDLMKTDFDRIDSLYFIYYDTKYDIVELENGSCSFTDFNIWDARKTAKVQCDSCALMLPSQFRTLLQPSLRALCRKLDHSVYHMDRLVAIKHLDALLEIEELDAIQGTYGADSRTAQTITGFLSMTGYVQPVNFYGLGFQRYFQRLGGRNPQNHQAIRTGWVPEDVQKRSFVHAELCVEKLEVTRLPAGSK